MESLSDFDLKLAHSLAASGSSESPCPLTTAELRRLVVEYLKDYDEELARPPDLRHKAHWNLWQWDELGRFDRESNFVVLIVRPNGLEFACGFGRQQAVREFSEIDFPDDVESLVAELARRFALPYRVLRIDRLIAEAWVGRDLGLHV